MLIVSIFIMLIIMSCLKASRRADRHMETIQEIREREGLEKAIRQLEDIERERTITEDNSKKTLRQRSLNRAKDWGDMTEGYMQENDYLEKEVVEITPCDDCFYYIDCHRNKLWCSKGEKHEKV